MFCNNCGAQNPEGSNFCSKCGRALKPNMSQSGCAESRRTYKVEIFRKSQWFLINPAINISIDDRPQCSIADGQTLTLRLEEGYYEFAFSQTFRRKKVSLYLSKDTYIVLNWNRLTGSIEASVS